MISGSEALMRALEHQGVKNIFGYPGGSIMPVYDALYDHLDKLNHVLVRHEQGAAHAAEGFARVSGEVGVCRCHDRQYTDCGHCRPGGCGSLGYRCLPRGRLGGLDTAYLKVELHDS